MRPIFSSDVRALFSETWVSVGRQKPIDIVEKRKHPFLYGFGYSVGRIYAYFISRRVAQDMNFVSSVKNFVEQSRSNLSQEELSKSRSSTRFCSTQSIGKLVFLFPGDFVIGVRDSISYNIGRFFPQKGDQPANGLDFNYYVTEVIFEYLESYGRFYYGKNVNIDIVFDVDVAFVAD